jgi:hypothetical protein
VIKIRFNSHFPLEYLKAIAIALATVPIRYWLHILPSAQQPPKTDCHIFQTVRKKSEEILIGGLSFRNGVQWNAKFLTR